MEDLIREYFSSYATSPFLVYGAIVGFMLLSAFGLPIPEEVVLISAGFVGYISLQPELAAHDGWRVNVYVLAAVAFCAVMGADFLIYHLGKRFGPKLFKLRWFNRLVSEQNLERTQAFMHKYGYWAVIIFRFTPGVRFPGHLLCGAMGLSPWKFIAVDAIAAGISVPTQVLAVSFYGEYILKYFKAFKLYLLGAFVVGLVVFLLYKLYQQRRSVTPSAAE